MNVKDAAELARIMDVIAAQWELTDEQRTLMRETVAESAKDLAESDGWYYLGPSAQDLYLHELAERISCDEKPLSFLDYEEARADAAC